jgi:DNA uptake protein ComE-like DNA-binding protein
VSRARLRPADVSPANAEHILGVLNRMASAAELAAVVELADEPDLGLRLAQQLLARRAEVGGSFASLEQVAGTPDIGPVRFTRLIRALSLPPPEPPPRILPGQVTPVVGFRILAVLNAARSAAELAATIELDDEPDIGLRLAQRLLARRAELGGAFTTLAQVDETPEIGVVRFTRIVRALAPTVPSAQDVPLEVVVADLKEAVELLSRPPRVAVGERASGRYLGQPATLVATVYGRDGRLAGDAVVTLSTNWGVLAAADGYTLQRSTAVVVRTAADGTIEIQLEPPTSEDLRGGAQLAVELALDGLDPQAPTPEAVAPQLREIARDYRWEVNDDLRAGIDVYFRDFHQHLLDRVNYLDELQAWTYVDAVVTANLLAADGGVEAAASVLVRFKDWLGPWLQEHVALANEESGLAADLARAVHSADSDELLTRVHIKAGREATTHVGVVGGIVGRRIVDDALGEFLTTHIDELPVGERVKVFPALRSARATVRSAGAPVFDAFARTRAAHADTAAQLAESAAGFATKDDVQLAIAELATKADVQGAVESFASNVNTTLAKAQSFSDLRAGIPFRNLEPGR